MNTSPIESFDGNYRYLSNFYPCPHHILYEGVDYPTTEHAYQAAKCIHRDDKFLISRLRHASLAKKHGKLVQRRPDFDAVKLQVMLDVLRLKFKQEPFTTLLISTAGRDLIEGNTWGDVFWGVCEGKGENHLGRLLMKVRRELVKSEEVNRV